jgi:phosphatidylglycerophosphate synthase
MKLPDMHRAPEVAQWDLIPPEQWNPYQIRAAQTHGWDTPGNRETAKGILAVTAGLYLIAQDTPLSTLAGTALIGYGRSRDITDGREAERTQTKSPDGKRNDAVGDALLMLLALKVNKQLHIVDQPEATLLGVTLVAKSAATGVAVLRKRTIDVERTGKFASVAEWSGLGLYLAGRVAGKYGFENADDEFRKYGRIVMDTGVALAVASAGSYLYNSLRPAPDA